MSYLNISLETPLHMENKGTIKEYLIGPDKKREGSFYISELPCNSSNENLRKIQCPFGKDIEIQTVMTDGSVKNGFLSHFIHVNVNQLSDIPKYEILNQEIDYEYEPEF